MSIVDALMLMLNFGGFVLALIDVIINIVNAIHGKKKTVSKLLGGSLTIMC